MVVDENIFVVLWYPAGSSVNSATFEEISKFCLNVRQWEGCFFMLNFGSICTNIKVIQNVSLIWLM